jgi:hypothetical protein
MISTSTFPFTGKITRVVIDISKESFAELSEEVKAARAKIMMGMQ